MVETEGAGMRLVYLAIWHFRRWMLKREWFALCDLYERADCGRSLSEFISPSLAIRRRKFDVRLRWLRRFEAKKLGTGSGTQSGTVFPRP